MKNRYCQFAFMLLALGNAAFCVNAQNVIHNEAPDSLRVLETPIETSEIFGRSVQGRPLYAHVLGNGPDVTLIFAAVHGNETATPHLVKELRAHLKQYPGWLQGRRVVLVSALNPDGLQKRSRLNARGVDINRNYPGTWRRPRSGERFRPGAYAASEPETQAMIRLVNKYRPHKIVSIHQPLHCIALRIPVSVVEHWLWQWQSVMAIR